ILTPPTFREPLPTQVLPPLPRTGGQSPFDNIPTPIPTPPSSAPKHKTWIIPLVSLTILVIGAMLVGTVGYSTIYLRGHSLIPTPSLVAASTIIEIDSDFPTSGLDTTTGLPMRDGVQMAITKANNDHLLPGYTLKLVSYDDVGKDNRHNPQVGAENLQ